MNDAYRALLQPNEPLEHPSAASADWKEHQATRRRRDDAAFWDERSKTFTPKDSPSSYVDQFMSLAAVQPGESLFDMGCGTGALALPYGRLGHPVLACDFSQGMLGILQEEIAREDLHTIETKLLSWDDSWVEAGITPQSADIAIASRSIATDDLERALLKLTAVARRRVCVTLTADFSPRVNAAFLKDLGLVVPAGEDFRYAFNILVDHGYMPEISYIESARTECFASREDARDHCQAMIDRGAPFATSQQKEQAQARLDAWLDEHLVPAEDDPKLLELLPPRKVTWAFLSWSPLD